MEVRIYSMIAAFVVLLCFSCTNRNASPVKKKNESAGNEKIGNNISLQTNHVVVSRAYLIHEDGTLVPPPNRVAVNQPVKLRILVAKGWKETNGKVAIGASETITTHDGQVVLHEEDLFRDIKQLDANDAHVITLTAAITLARKETEYFVVTFRIWDKNGPGDIKGHYKLYLQ